MNRPRHERPMPRQLLRHRLLPHGHLDGGAWLQGALNKPRAAELLVQGARSFNDDGRAKARSLLMFRPNEQELTRQSSGPHAVLFSTFTLTHAPYLAATLSMGQTLRKGFTIDCTRNEDAERTGVWDKQWLLHLEVMFSRATRMQNIVTLRPPSREFLERLPPASLRKTHGEFDMKTASSKAEAEQLAAKLGFALPPA
eukprot:6060959-Pyramimonas_sp.AAC.1